MAANQAYQLCVGLFKQSSSGTAYAKLKESDYAALKWDLTSSIIPVEYKFTNFDLGDATTETTDLALITDVSKYARYASGRTTPPTATFANLRPADVASIYDTLDAVTGVDDARLCLLAVGVLNTSSSLTLPRTYDVILASAAIVTTDGALNGEAGQNFTSSLGLQLTGSTLRSATTCAATLTWAATNVVSFAANT